MARVAPPALPVPPTVFKHFAAVTITVTVLVALFATGGEPSVQTVKAAQAPQPDAIQLAAEGKKANEIKVRDKTKMASSGWGEENDPNAGMSIGSGFSEMGSVARSAITQVSDGIAAGPPPGMSLEEWQSLLARRRANHEQATPDQIEQMIRASSLRSGNAGGD